jgi:hypothetical protein
MVLGITPLWLWILLLLVIVGGAVYYFTGEEKGVMMYRYGIFYILSK